MRATTSPLLLIWKDRCPPVSILLPPWFTGRAIPPTMSVASNTTGRISDLLRNSRETVTRLACTDDHRSFLAHLFPEFINTRDQALDITDTLLVGSAWTPAEVWSSKYLRDHETFLASKCAHSDKRSAVGELVPSP